jgi:hypothetical protein
LGIQRPTKPRVQSGVGMSPNRRCSSRPRHAVGRTTSRGGGSPGLGTAPRSRQMLIACAFLGHQHLAFIGGYKSTDPALSDLGCDRSVRGLYAHPAIFLRASPPVPSRNILRARAIPLSAVPEVEALPDRSEQNLPARVVSAPGHGLAACIWRRRAKPR